MTAPTFSPIDAISRNRFPSVSTHFGRDECVVGATEHGIDIQTIPPGVWNRMVALAGAILEPWRQDVGPLQVTRWYANEALNKAQGGVQDSQHMLGEAIDVVPVGMNVRLAYEKLLRGSYSQNIDQVILYPRRNFIHVSHKSDRSDVRPNRLEHLFSPWGKSALVRRAGKRKYFDYEKWWSTYEQMGPRDFGVKF